MLDAIVYNSHTGHTKQYALELGERLSLPVYSLKESKKISKGSNIIFLSWVKENILVKYDKVRKFNILSCIGVGIRKYDENIINLIKDETNIDCDLFYLRGGIKKNKLGIRNYFTIKLIGDELSYKAIDKTASFEELEMLDAILNNLNFVNLKELDKIEEIIRKKYINTNMIN